MSKPDLSKMSIKELENLSETVENLLVKRKDNFYSREWGYSKGKRISP